MGFLELIKNIDFLGPQIGFEYKEKKNYQTIQGMLYSLFIISITTVIGFLFGQEIYQRKLPITSNSQEIIPNSRINITDFPLVFAFDDAVGNNIPSIGSFIKWDLVTFAIAYNGSVTRIVHDLELKICDFSTFPDFLADAVRNDLTTNTKFDFYCFDPSGYFFENPFANLNSQYINIRFRVCDPTQFTCFPNVLSYIDNIFVNLIYFDSYIDSTNYTQPVQYASKSINTQLGNALLNRMFMRVINNIINADDGWLLADVYQKNYITLDSYLITYDFIESNSVNPLDRLWITFESPKLRNSVYRSYLKIQDLLAKLGGLAKFFITFIEIISQHHLKFLYLTFIKRIVNAEIEYQVNDEKRMQFKTENNNDLNKNNLNTSNIQLIDLKNAPRNLKTEEADFKKIEVFDSYNKKPSQIVNTGKNDFENDRPVLTNNFILKSKTMKEFYVYHTENFTYFDYLKAMLTCNTKKLDLYDKNLDSVKKLVDIKLFSQLMVNVHHRFDDKSLPL